MRFTDSATPVLLVRRLLAVTFLAGIAMFSAGPAGASHLSGCVDTAGAEVDDHMEADTPIACPDSAGPIPGGAEEGGTGAEAGDVPNRIDAGAGGAVAPGASGAVGAGLAGAASAGAAGLAAWRRRRR